MKIKMEMNIYGDARALSLEIEKLGRKNFEFEKWDKHNYS